MRNGRPGRAVVWTRRIPSAGRTSAHSLGRGWEQPLRLGGGRLPGDGVASRSTSSRRLHEQPSHPPLRLAARQRISSVVTCDDACRRIEDAERRAIHAPSSRIVAVVGFALSNRHGCLPQGRHDNSAVAVCEQVRRLRLTPASHRLDPRTTFHMRTPGRRATHKPSAHTGLDSSGRYQTQGSRIGSGAMRSSPKIMRTPSGISPSTRARPRGSALQSSRS